MFILGNFFNAIATILSYIIQLYTIVIFSHAILSWVHIDPYNPIVRTIAKIAEPFLSLIRSRIRMITYNLGLDISPIIAYLILVVIDKFLVASLFDLAIKLK